MRSLRPGAQRASFSTRLSALLAASLLASLFAFGVTAAAPGGVSAATPRWYTVETYYLRLLNCTRTGGWVLENGSCAGYGSGQYSTYVAPIKRSDGIAAVARGWARKIATAGACKHGDPGARLRNAGYRGWSWGENIGCWDIGPFQSVLATHLAFQAEKASNGGHWKNIKNPRFKYAGIGVWRANGHTRLVTDFYTP
ncbi:MAG TPA: hypothetical protein VES19_08915 [Candidatus Limnocylindrales bacterium]|nr:hypothetical protein [Candidatus Limnocylindrales bacterium]